MTPPPQELPMRPAWRCVGWWVVCLAVLATWWPRRSGPLDLRWDAGVYSLLGDSLARGEGLRLANEPGPPLAAIQYPPGLPALVALHARVVGDDPVRVASVLRGTWCAASLLLAFLTWCLARRVLVDGFVATCATLAAVLHVQFVFQSNLLGAELPFSLLAVAFFLAQESRRRLVRASGGLWLALAYAFRTSGVALLAAWIGAAVVRRRGRAALLRTSVAVLVVAPWLVYTRSVERSPEYRQPTYAYQRADYQHYNVGYLPNLRLVDSFRPEQGHVDRAGLVRRAAAGLAQVPGALVDAVGAWPGFWERSEDRRDSPLYAFLLPPGVVLVLRVGLGALLLGGLVAITRQGREIWTLGILATVGMIVLTPWPGQFARYLAVLGPLLSLVCAAVPAALWRRRTGRIFAGALVLVPVGLAGFSTAQMLRMSLTEVPIPDRSGAVCTAPLLYHDRPFREFDAATDWIRANTAPGAVIASSLPHWVYHRTGHPSIYPPFEADPAKARALLEDAQVRVLLADHGGVGPDVAGFYGLPAMRGEDSAPARGGWQRRFVSAGGLAEVWVRDE